MTEKFETSDKYVELIKNSRNPPFIMIDVSELNIRDYERHVGQTNVLSKIKISEAVKINYYPNGPQ